MNKKNIKKKNQFKNFEIHYKKILKFLYISIFLYGVWQNKSNYAEQFFFKLFVYI